MTRDEVQTVIDAIYQRSETKRSQAATDHIDRIQALAEARGLDEAATALGRALEKSEVSERPARARKEVRIERHQARRRGIGYGAAWGEKPFEIPEAGPGLWVCIGIRTVDGGDFVV